MTDENASRPVSTVGLFGKLPAHGDFVQRNVPGTFVDTWDEWLMRCVQSSRDALGEHWLDVYLTSPIWRFALSPGAVDAQAWAGIVMPSVDSVGRYYPLTVVQRLPEQVNVIELVSAQTGWFEKFETLALRGLEEGLDADQLYAEFQGIAAPGDAGYRRDDASLCWRAAPEEVGTLTRNVAIGMDGNADHPVSTLPMLTDWLVSRSFPSYSVWHTLGSDYVQPVFLVAAGLPDVSGATAMLDGRWQERSWQSPYVLSTVNGAVDQGSVV